MSSIFPWGTYRYYYYRLSESERKAYAHINKGVCAGESSVIWKKDGDVDFHKVFSALSADNAMPLATSWKYTDVLICRVEPQYDDSLSIRKGKIEYLEKEIRRIGELCRAGTDLRRTIVKIHDYLVDHVVYDETAADCFTPLGVLKGRAVCSGIARFVKLICDYLHIPCVYVFDIKPNASDDGHAWNAINVHDDWFGFDFTWDICHANEMLKSSKDSVGRISYSYFGLPWEDMIKDHKYPSATFPKPTGVFDYFTIKGLIVHNMSELKKTILAISDDDIVIKIAPSWKDFDLEKARDVISDTKQRGFTSWFNDDQRVISIRFS